MRVAGVMSGTSLDGIDVAVVEIRGGRIQTIGFQSTAYPETTRAALLGELDAARISRLNFELGNLYARAARKAVQRFGPVRLIGCHGQTIYHEGRSHTLQIGEPAVIAEALGVPVGTVRSRLSRARAKLHKFAAAELAGPGGEPGPGREPGLRGEQEEGGRSIVARPDKRYR